MLKEKSAGLILFFKIKEKKKSYIKYLLIKVSPKKHWVFPRGIIEKNESEIETALRETEEETGINRKNIEIVFGFKETLHWFYKREGQLISKEAIFFLGKIVNIKKQKIY